MRRLLALAAALLSSIANAAPEPSVTMLERGIFTDCARVLDKSATVDNASAMAALGYSLDRADEEGLWAAKAIGKGHIRIGTSSGKPGCRIRYSGPSAVTIYEDLLARLIERGLVFSDGMRKPAEPRFVMDTLVQEDGSIGIVSMFRMNSADATGFAMTIFPSSAGSRK